MHLAPTQTPTLEDVLGFFSRYSFDKIAIQLLFSLIYIVAAWIFLAVIFRLVAIIRHFREPAVILEITPPQDTKIATNSTAQLFNLFSSLLSHLSFIDRLLLRQVSGSFEIVSRKETGIQYFVWLPKILAGTFSKNLRAYIPEITIKEAADYLPNNLRHKRYRVSEYKLAKHFSFPILEHLDLKNHDPLAYLTANMFELKTNDLLSLQVVLKPLDGGKRREISKLKSMIRQNRFGDWQPMMGLLLFSNLLEGMARLIMVPLMFAGDFVTGNDSKLPERAPSKPKAINIISEPEEAVKAKLNEPLMEVSIRSFLIAGTGLEEREKGFLASFSSYRHPLGQAITRSKSLWFTIFSKFGYWLFRARLISSNMVLSSGEIASLYHFPFSTSPEHSDLVRSKSRELPAPLSLKQTDSKYDVVFGVNKFGNEVIPIGLTLEQRQKHMYIIGKTGMGKTTLLKNAIYQDMLSGKGLAVLDPHGDLFSELLQIIPENRKKDVIVFNPSDRECPIGLNILAPGIHFKDIDEEQDKIASSVIAVFKKIAKDFWGPRMEHVLKNATLTALQIDNPSLYTLQRLLTDKGYQKKVAATLKDPVLRQFWNKEFSLLGTMQLGNVTAPLTQRLGSFITTKMSRHILLQEKSTISISKIMDEGKILLVNLSKGELGEDMSFFFGTVLTSLVWMAAYKRTEIPEKERKDFFFYVDEFQNFATPSLSEITSEGRKYHVSLIACHQNLAQVEDKDILKVVAGNANTIICLKASPDDENFILPFMEPEVEKGDIVNLAPYRFFMKLTNERSENAFSGQTVPLDIEPSEKIKADVIDYSRKHNATPRKEVEEYLDKLFTGRLETTPTPKKPESKKPAKAQKKTEAKEVPKVTKKPRIKRLEV